MRRRTSTHGLLPILFVSIGLPAFSGCEDGGNEYVAPPPPPVTVARPTEREVTPTNRYIGRIAAKSEVEVRARVRGFLREQLFEPGDIVSAGDVLFRIEPEEFQARVNSAEAALQRTKVTAELARIRLERTQRAFDAGAVSDLELLEVQAEHEDSKAAILEAQASLETAELDLRYTEVLAPADGRAAEPAVDVGNLVGASDATLLTTIVGDREVYVYFEATERELLVFLEELDGPREKPRRNEIPVGIYLADGSRYAAEAIVDYADPQLDRETGTITIRAVAPNPDGRLVSGMVVRAELSGKPRKAVLVPQTAVLRDIGGAYVFTLDAANTVVRSNVSTGTSEGEMMIVEEGLTPEDRVIVNGTQRAREGLTVNPQSAPAG